MLPQDSTVSTVCWCSTFRVSHIFEENSHTGKAESLPPCSIQDTKGNTARKTAVSHLSRNNWRQDFRVSVQGEGTQQLVEMLGAK